MDSFDGQRLGLVASALSRLPKDPTRNRSRDFLFDKITWTVAEKMFSCSALDISRTLQTFQMTDFKPSKNFVRQFNAWIISGPPLTGFELEKLLYLSQKIGMRLQLDTLDALEGRMVSMLENPPADFPRRSAYGFLVWFAFREQKMPHRFATSFSNWLLNQTPESISFMFLRKVMYSWPHVGTMDNMPSECLKILEASLLIHMESTSPEDLSRIIESFAVQSHTLSNDVLEGVEKYILDNVDSMTKEETERIRNAFKAIKYICSDEVGASLTRRKFQLWALALPE